MTKLFLGILITGSTLLIYTQSAAQTEPTKAITAENSPAPAAKVLDTIHTDKVVGVSTAAVTALKPANTLNITADVRVRTEYRHGYRNIPLKDTAAAFFVNQRTRLNFDFKSKHLDFFLSVQDARVWGEQDPRGGQGATGTTASPATVFPIYLYESYVEPHLNDRLSVRIGRQRIMYDNQRLFAENDWRLAGNSHDALRVMYNNKTNLATELTFAFNQSSENIITTNYTPLVKNYKNLLVHYLNYKFSKSVTLTTLNTMDGYQSAYDYRTTYQRFTNGGRLEYQSSNWYATFSGYYQFGKDSSGNKLSAYYIQPEIKYTSKGLSARLGLEYLSGQDSTSTKNNNFVPLYGVAHRFMGNLDLFTSFPGDVKNGGLLNPYLFFQYTKDKWNVRFENHLFYSHTAFPFRSLPSNNKFLGFENDIRINYKPTPIFDIEYGFCWALVTNSMLEVKNTIKTKEDLSKYSKTPYWSYISLKVTPVLGKFTF